MYGIAFSQAAENDMQSVFEWIAEEKGMAQTAMRYAAKMKQAITEIAKHPYFYGVRNYPLFILQNGLDVRRFNFRKFSILFSVLESGNLIYIHRVMAIHALPANNFFELNLPEKTKK